MKLIPRTTSWNFESFELLWGAEATWSFLKGDLIVFGKRLGTLSWFLLRSWFLRQDNDLVVLQLASSFFSAWSLEAIGFTKPDDNKKVNLPLDSWRRRRRSCWRYVRPIRQSNIKLRVRSFSCLTISHRRLEIRISLHFSACPSFISPSLWFSCFVWVLYTTKSYSQTWSAILRWITRTRPISEVKQRQAWVVLGWVTTGEVHVLIIFLT